MSIAAKANKVCKSSKKPMSIPSKTRKDQKAHEHSSNPCEKLKKTMSIATKTKRNKRPPEPPQHILPFWRPQRWQTLPSRTPTQLRLARSLARTTRTRNETETDFPIGGLLRRLIPLNLRSMKQNVCCGSRHIFYRNRLLMDGRWLPVNSRPMIS